jgi:hypothetical protein
LFSLAYDLTVIAPTLIIFPFAALIESRAIVCILRLFTWFGEEPVVTMRLLHFELFICYCPIKIEWKLMHISLHVLVDQAVEPMPQRKEAAHLRY